MVAVVIDDNPVSGLLRTFSQNTIECTLPHEINLIYYHRLNVKWPPQAHVFENLVPSKWQFREVTGPSGGWNLNRTSRPLGKLWGLLARSSF